MKYASIKSTEGGKAPQMYPGTQPLSKVATVGTYLKAPERTSSKKPPQMNKTGVSVCKP